VIDVAEAPNIAAAVGNQRLAVEKEEEEHRAEQEEYAMEEAQKGAVGDEGAVVKVTRVE
jgi:hypothetical protein